MPCIATVRKCIAVGRAEEYQTWRRRKTVRLFQDSVEHRGEIAGRGIDDLEYLGGRGLLLQSLVRLGQEPRILHRDDRLRREVLEQRNLLIAERPDLLAICDKRAQ